MEKLLTFETGPIRPTNEYASLLIRVTRGCHWNRCRFCHQYKGHPFSVRPLEEVKADIDAAATCRDRILRHRRPDGTFDRTVLNADYGSLSTNAERENYLHVFQWLQFGDLTVFLQDGDATTLQTEYMTEVVRHVRLRFPEVTRVTAYARADTLCRKTPVELTALREAGLDRIHSGYESGHDQVLKNINKGITSAQEIEGGLKAKESGIELSVFLMQGLGGKRLSEENAMETARVINAVDPDFVRLRTAVVNDDAPLWSDLQAGVFDECTDMEQLWEMRQFVAQLQNCHGYLYSDHMINLMQEVEGPLTDSASLVAMYDAFFALDRRTQRRYQVAKRSQFNGTWKEMHLLSEKDQKMIDRIVDSVPDGPEFEEWLKSRLRRYI